MSSMVDLPAQLLIDILSKLPIKSVLLCRCVCKLWLDLLSTRSFADLYASTGPTTLLLQPTNICTSGRDRTNLKTSHLFHLQAYTNRSTDFMLPFKPGTNLPNLDFCFVSSCNGLLSLYDPQTNDPIYVCNPISGEFITLPKSPFVALSRVVARGFGFAPWSKQYKVIRVVQVGYGHFATSRTAEIYTLGEGTWRSLGDACKFPHRVAYNTFLNGILHWDTYYYEPYISFDFETERFGKIDCPQLNQTDMQKRSLGVLRDCLSVCCFENPAHIDIWVMKDYGVKESWTKQYVIESTKEFILQNSISQRIPGLLYCELITVLEGGDIVMLFDKRSLVVCDPESQCFRLLAPFSAKFEAVAYVPTLVSLKNVATKENIKACAIELPKLGYFS